MTYPDQCGSTEAHPGHGDCPGLQPPPEPADTITMRVEPCAVTEHHGEHAYDYDGPWLWCRG